MCTVMRIRSHRRSPCRWARLRRAAAAGPPRPPLAPSFASTRGSRAARRACTCQRRCPRASAHARRTFGRRILGREVRQLQRLGARRSPRRIEREQGLGQLERAGRGHVLIGELAAQPTGQLLGRPDKLVPGQLGHVGPGGEVGRAGELVDGRQLVELVLALEDRPGREKLEEDAPAASAPLQ